MNTIFWPPISEKSKSKLKTPVKFKLQIDRTPIYKMTNDVNENRFEMIDKKVEVLSNLHKAPQ